MALTRSSRRRGPGTAPARRPAPSTPDTRDTQDAPNTASAPAGTGTPGQAPGTDDASARIARTIDRLGSVVAPVTALTAIGFYIGWRRTNSYAIYFGIDPSVLGFTTQEYLLRSWTTAYPVLVGLIVVAGSLRLAHLVLDQVVRDRPAARLVPPAFVAGGVLGLLLLLSGVLRRAIAGSSFLTQDSVTVGLAGLVLYGFVLWRRGTGRQPPGRWGGLERGLLVSLFLLAAFSVADKYAAVRGFSDAEFMAGTLADRRGVVVYSEQDLSLPAVVPASRPSGSSPRYRVRYDGLRLFVHHGDQYFLLPQQWSRADDDPEPDVLIILTDSDKVRFEFTPGRG